MAPPAEKKKKHSSVDHRLISSTANGGKQQQWLGSVMTEFGKRRSVRVATKKNRRWLCNDVLMDIFPFFGRPQLGLKLALISPRFDALVDTHFDGKSGELTLWRTEIIKSGKKTKLIVSVMNGNAEPKQFPLPDRPLYNKIRFRFLRIDYIDHFVIEFLRCNKQIFDKRGTNLRLWQRSDEHTDEQQPIWDVFVREIWPIFVPNIRCLHFYKNDHLVNLLRHTSPTILTDLNQLNKICFDHLLSDVGDENGPNATSAGQALFDWLHTPSKDGKPKLLHCLIHGPSNEWIVRVKEAFPRSTISANYEIRLGPFNSTQITPFELTNGRTNEKLTLGKEGYHGNANVDWVLKRCQIGKTTTAFHWENENWEHFNNVKFCISNVKNSIGPLSPPAAAGQKNAKSRLKMSAGPSGQKKCE